MVISMPGTVARRLYHQLVQFLLIAIYLFVVFGILALHEEVVAAKNHITYHFYGFALINAIILGKVMLVAEDLNFGNRFFRTKPLVYPIVFKAIVFTLLSGVRHCRRSARGSLQREDNRREPSRYWWWKPTWNFLPECRNCCPIDPVLRLSGDWPSDRGTRTAFSYFHPRQIAGCGPGPTLKLTQRNAKLDVVPGTPKERK